jgi:hypothetical protein
MFGLSLREKSIKLLKVWLNEYKLHQIGNDLTFLDSVVDRAIEERDLLRRWTPKEILRGDDERDKLMGRPIFYIEFKHVAHTLFFCSLGPEKYADRSTHQDRLIFEDEIRGYIKDGQVETSHLYGFVIQEAMQRGYCSTEFIQFLDEAKNSDHAANKIHEDS